MGSVGGWVFAVDVSREILAFGLGAYLRMADICVKIGILILL